MRFNMTSIRDTMTKARMAGVVFTVKVIGKR